MVAMLAGRVEGVCDSAPEPRREAWGGGMGVACGSHDAPSHSAQGLWHQQASKDVEGGCQQPVAARSLDASDAWLLCHRHPQGGRQVCVQGSLPLLYDSELGLGVWEPCGLTAHMNATPPHTHTRLPSLSCKETEGLDTSPARAGMLMPCMQASPPAHALHLRCETYGSRGTPMLWL